MLNLPELTAQIGDRVKGDNENMFSSLIKQVKGIKENEEAFIYSLIFDLKNKVIDFEFLEQYSEDSTSKYNYFGNNSAASSQYYLVRDTASLHYLLSTVWNDLYLMLSKHGMHNGELVRRINEMDECGLISLKNKVGEGKVNLYQFSLFKKNTPKEVEINKKKKVIQFDDHTYKFEAFVRLFLDDENKKNRYVLVVPKIRLGDGQEIFPSIHPDFLELVKQAKNLGNDVNKGSGTKRVCHLCGQKKTDVHSKYSKSFARSGINKIFTTTTISTSPFLQKFNYDNVYSICPQCYQRLLSGEKFVSTQFGSKIAGENVFIIPDGLTGSFDYNHVIKLKKHVDLAFKSKNAEEWLKEIKSSAFFDGIDLYSLNFIFYRTDGNSVTVMETIEDVPTLRFEKVIKTLSECAFKLKPHLNNMSLGSLYRIIPVRTNKGGEQLDINRVISLYRAILSNEQINTQTFYNYASEALDKGLRQLNRDKIDNFTNMGLGFYRGSYSDFFIKQLIMSYLTLIRTCQSLGLLNKPVFNFNGKGETELEQINTASQKINASIIEMEEFLENQGFKKEARALFYLGILINRVAVTQLLKEHKTKPILRKIQFQGMKDKEVYRLYEDVLEKLRQYNKMTLLVEAVMNRFHHHYGSLHDNWPFSERENVFYIMSGYAYLVGKKAPDLTEDEQNAVADEVDKEDLTSKDTEF